MSIINKTFANRSTAAGFSLVEVLVAMLILAIGLLGLAALQTQGVRFNNDAFTRTQGTTIAYDIINKLRANRANVVNYTTANFPARNPPPPGGGNYTWASPPYNCNPLLATVANDLACWLNTVELVLPYGSNDHTGQTTIAQQAAPNANLFNISISWLDRRYKSAVTCNGQTNHVWFGGRCLVNQIWTVWP